MLRFWNVCFVLSSVTVMGQRPQFAGSRPIGYPELYDRTTESTDGLGNRFGEGDNSTSIPLPLEANGDRELVNRLSKLPVDQQPFWFINWQALEQNRKNPQTYPQKPNPFLEPLNLNAVAEPAPNAVNGATNNAQSTNTGNGMDNLQNKFSDSNTQNNFPTRNESDNNSNSNFQNGIPNSNLNSQAPQSNQNPNPNYPSTNPNEGFRQNMNFQNGNGNRIPNTNSFPQQPNQNNGQVYYYHGIPYNGYNQNHYPSSPYPNYQPQGQYYGYNQGMYRSAPPVPQASNVKQNQKMNEQVKTTKGADVVC